MVEPSQFKKFYDDSRKELADLLLQQAEVEKNLIRVRKDIAAWAVLCENNGIKIEPSAEAEYLLKTSLADEIRNILTTNYDKEFRPNELKEELKRLGHDLAKYSNPQSAIHMVLKRMEESGEIKEREDGSGKATYLMEHPLRSALRGYRSLSKAAGDANETLASAIANIAKGLKK